MNTPREDTDAARRFLRARRRALLTWFALLVLLGLSAGAARLHLGTGNLIVSMGIAALKIMLVGWIFMSLAESHALPRLAAAAGVVALIVLVALSSVDALPRHDEPSRWQMPQGVPAVLSQQHPSPTPH